MIKLEFQIPYSNVFEETYRFFYICAKESDLVYWDLAALIL